MVADSADGDWPAEHERTFSVVEPSATLFFPGGANIERIILVDEEGMDGLVLLSHDEEVLCGAIVALRLWTLDEPLREPWRGGIDASTTATGAAFT